MPRKGNAPPYQYTDAILSNISSMAACGNSLETIAAMIDRDYVSFITDMKKKPEVRKAYNKGKNTGIASVSQKLYKKATEKDASPALMIQWLEYRDRKTWKRTEHIEHTGADGGAIIMGDESAADKKARKARVLADLKILSELGDDETQIES